MDIALSVRPDTWTGCPEARAVAGAGSALVLDLPVYLGVAAGEVAMLIAALVPAGGGPRAGRRRVTPIVTVRVEARSALRPDRTRYVAGHAVRFHPVPHWHSTR
ncbi:hypothetical protein ACPPVO_39355 [Dactylosporangium sp. McL0621]|uniref:hypothetical protein n=1 Tax=Dactylosporangium sp. McL0621 TaxID=3415678 RepID=UPI003CF98BA4